MTRWIDRRGAAATCQHDTERNQENDEDKKKQMTSFMTRPPSCKSILANTSISHSDQSKTT